MFAAFLPRRTDRNLLNKGSDFTWSERKSLLMYVSMEWKFQQIVAGVEEAEMEEKKIEWRF